MALVFLLASCRSAKFTDDPVMPPGHRPGPIEVVPPEPTVILVPAPEMAEIVPVSQPFEMLGIIKEPCYGGGCPHYTFSLRNDGLAHLECHSGCGMPQGKYYARLGEEVSSQLLQFMWEAQVMELSSSYPEDGRPVAYIPKTTFRLGLGEGIQKQVDSYHHSPALLLQLEDWAAEWIAEAQWEAYK